MASLDPQKKPDIFIVRGDSCTITLSVGMDLTGATVFFTAKPALTDDADDSTAVIEKEVTDHVDAVGGLTTIPLTAADTTVTPGEYFYDIQIKIGDAITSSSARKLKVYADVTRRTT